MFTFDTNLGIDAVLPNDRHGHARCLLQHRDEEVGPVDHQMARAAGMVKRELATSFVDSVTRSSPPPRRRDSSIARSMDPSERVTDLAYGDVEVVDVHDVRPVVGTAGTSEQPTDLKCPSRDRRAAAFEREAARRSPAARTSTSGTP